MLGASIGGSAFPCWKVRVFFQSYLSSIQKYSKYYYFLLRKKLKILFICRLSPLKLPINWKMGDLKVINNNAGAEFTVIDARPMTLLDCGPDTWPMKDVTISNPCVPFYLPLMYVGRSLFLGKEPLCKVQVTLVQDGCILGIALSHLLTDGMHWPKLMRHIAARYRQVTTGQEAAPEELISQLITRQEGLSLEQLQKKLGG